jgi:hypothetical protein
MTAITVVLLYDNVTQNTAPSAGIRTSALLLFMGVPNAEPSCLGQSQTTLPVPEGEVWAQCILSWLITGEETGERF